MPETAPRSARRPRPRHSAAAAALPRALTRSRPPPSSPPLLLWYISRYLAFRDHMGITPLYTGYGPEGSIWFASELKVSEQ